LWAEGQLVPKDEARAVVAFTKACDAGSATGCGNLALMLDEGMGVERDKAGAARAWGQACKLGDRESCAKVAPRPATCEAECRQLLDQGSLREGTTFAQCVATLCTKK
jgi:TPR repeat protein